MSNKNIKISSNKSFAFVFSFVFVIIGLYPLINNEGLRYWSLFLSLILLLLGFRNSILLTPLNSIWFKFGLLLGKIFAPVVMGIVYFVVVYPTNLLLKIFKNDHMGIKYNKEMETYWVNVKNNESNMKDQF
jgi:predicted membrane protein|tara:strand:- start:130 stop:522 length:393 start_codon:yes stop_codon:yes gene_type:complete